MNWLSLLIPWRPSPTIVAITIATAWLFIRGCRRQPVSVARQLGFWAGLAVLYAALHTWLDYYSEREFFIGRVQQLALHDFGPFLLALAAPGAVLWAGVPERWRVRWLEPIRQARLTGKLGRVMTHPAAVGIIYVGLGWFWLLPYVHFYAMLDVFLYRLMNWSMVCAGLLFWSLVLDLRKSPPARLSAGVRLALIAAIMPLQMAPGILLTFSTTNFYPLYDLCGRAFSGINFHEDQTIGGLIIWIPGSMMNLVGALTALYLGFFRETDGEANAPRRAAGSGLAARPGP
ncbi:MAG TPA: cytochrome c oxidase assembly protein [Opitutaceae bacterium]|nr:cytochrome c oxidase assembly protein [Opitutaceae bacterium]